MTSRPRILHLDAGREWRGGQRQVLLLAEGLRERGYEPLVVGAPGSPLVERLRARGIAASTIRMRADWDLAGARRLRALLRTWLPDIVHAHDARSHAIALAALFARRGARLPLVVTRRVPFPPKGVGLKYGSRVARFIAISGAVRDAMVTGGVAASRIDVVHSGVPAPSVATPRDWRAERGWPAESVVCGIVGAMSAEKGVAVLTEMGERLPAATRERMRLVLLGGPPQPATTEETIGGVRAFRAGFVEAVHEATAGLDVLLHPSRAEGLGTAVIDAMALGVPPVAFAIGGLPELIEAGRSGLLVPAGDVAALAREAERLVSDAALRRALAEGARDRARAFDVVQMVNGVERVYARVLAESPLR